MENKVIFRAGGEVSAIQFCPKSKLVKVQSGGNAQEICVLSTNKPIFRAGDRCVKCAEQTHKKSVVQTRYVTPQNLSRGDLAWKICDDMQFLSANYAALAKMNAEYADTFSDMQTELAIAAASMRKIAQSLSRTSRHAPQPYPVRFSTFCNGLSEAVVLQKRILTDLRHLQHMAENFSSQIVIIYLTVQAQNETTQSVLDSEC